MRTAARWIAGAALLLLAALAVDIGATYARIPAATGPATATSSVAVSRFALPASVRIDGLPVAEVSGLAWDVDARVLHAVSDAGYAYRFDVQLTGDTLVSVRPLAAVRLVDQATGEGTAASNKRLNAEGLALRNARNGVRDDAALLVALEENPPRIARFGAAGTLQRSLRLPLPLRDIAHYQQKNRGLESVVFDPVHGVMTAPEVPLRGQATGLHTVYAVNGAWSFPAYTRDSRLKGLALLPDGRLLVLERSRPTGSKHAQVASLRTIDLAHCGADVVCRPKLAAALQTGSKNFEGVAVLDAHHALIVSDNGGKGDVDTTFALIGLP